MTKNQIDYRTLVEGKRHNVAMEQETNRTNLANEDIRRRGNEISSERNDIDREKAYASLLSARAAGVSAAANAKNATTRVGELNQAARRDIYNAAAQGTKNATRQKDAETHRYEAETNRGRWMVENAWKALDAGSSRGGKSSSPKKPRVPKTGK
jgi:hypothetical protein